MKEYYIAYYDRQKDDVIIKEYSLKKWFDKKIKSLKKSDIFSVIINGKDKTFEFTSIVIKREDW